MGRDLSCCATGFMYDGARHDDGCQKRTPSHELLDLVAAKAEGVEFPEYATMAVVVTPT